MIPRVQEEISIKKPARFEQPGPEAVPPHALNTLEISSLVKDAHNCPLIESQLLLYSLIFF